MLVIDIYHFYYVYTNQLKYYLVDSNQRIINGQQPNRMDSLQRLNDLKWLQIENVEQINGKNDDQLRVTMAQNMFGNQELFNGNNGVSKLKKKKKKKINNININNNNNTINDNKKYSIDDDLFNLDLNLQVDQESPNKQS